jgi:hypothetical protein
MQKTASMRERRLGYLIQFLLKVPTLLLLFGVIQIQSVKIRAQKNFTLSGHIYDAETGETMIGAKIFFPQLSKGAVSNSYGFYSISIPEGTYDLQISYMGYETITQKIVLNANVKKDFRMKPKAKEMDEVVITAQNERANTESTKMGTVELDVEMMKTLPAFLGEVDVLKTIQLLPGVSSANEGAQGFYVRGGGPDQNLVLLDEATVYNASHLFGFFSVFNADAIKSVNIIKGGMPAEFGSRLASVLEVKMNDGNNQRFGIDGGIGLLSSRLTLQGPIVKDKASFIVSGRRTYLDLLMKAFIPEESNFYGTKYFFHDFTAKANYKITDKDRIFISGYFGRDEFSFNNNRDAFNVSMPWGNATATVRWNRIVNEKLFMNVSGIFTDYNFQFNSGINDFRINVLSGIRDFGGKIDFTWYPNPRHEIKFGTQYTYHIFTPTSLSAQDADVVFNTRDIGRIFGHEGALYIQDEFDITDVLRINVGLRYSWYNHVGPFTRYISIPGQIKDSTIVYRANESIKFYHGLEPRANLRYLLPDKSSIKVGFNQVNQYIHLATISPVSLPTDIWFPSTDIAQPQRGWQASVGYFRNLFDNKYETSVELYYKGMRNLIEYQNGALPSDNVTTNPDNLLVFGKGRSYGSEFFIRKIVGRATGWIGYTISRTERFFPDLQDTWFPARYDRTHDLSIAFNYKINDKWTAGAVFVYATGNTMTLPVAWYLHNGRVVYEYGARNTTRMPPYHRLDLSMTWYDDAYKITTNPETNEKIRNKKKFRQSVNFSIFNAYNRQNPYFVYVSNDGDPNAGELKIALKQVALFPILPSVTWNFNF